MHWEFQHLLSNKEVGQSTIFKNHHPHRTRTEAEGLYEHQFYLQYDFKILGLNCVCAMV
jgi:hypothetical protein